MPGRRAFARPSIDVHYTDTPMMDPTTNVTPAAAAPIST
jgi:hypothetical protein